MVYDVKELYKFPSRLRELRGDKTLSKSADGIGISKKTLERYEKGIMLPNIEMLFKLCKYYNVTADYMLGIGNLEERAEM